MDDAVLWIAIENALAEREEIDNGQHKESRQKYTLSQLLDAKFRLPFPEKQRPMTLSEAAQQPGGLVKAWGRATDLQS